MQQGTIFNIQRFSIHDGPGIRTTVFLKGCPLSCAWCHNPESQHAQPEIMVQTEKCVGCGACVAICPTGAATVIEGQRVAKPCPACGRCLSVCPQGALELVGKMMTVDEVMLEILKDQLFYDESGGGVTFSGGEPLQQPAFLQALLASCCQHGMHTVVDTSGYAPWPVVEKIAPLVDLFLYDVKLLLDERHLRYVGTSNKLMLHNLQRLVKISHVQVRIPIIPGVNDDETNLQATADFLKPLPLQGIKLLAYHNYGVPKYARLGKVYRLDADLPTGEEAMQRSRDRLRSLGLDVI